MSFNAIANSKTLGEAFVCKGLVIPKSPSTVREIFFKEFENSVAKLKEQITQEKVDGKRFSLCIDEATSSQNTRYLNLNLHFTENVYSLGVIRINGSLPAERLVDLVKDRLSYFGISMTEDIVTCTTDGASVMKKFGGSIEPIHGICFAHAIHLAVCDVLYRPASTTYGEDFLQSIDSSSEMFDGK